MTIVHQTTQEKQNKQKHRLYKYSNLNKTAEAVLQAVAANDKEKAITAVSFANKKLDKGQAKGIYHKNFVANHKSQLAILVNSL